MRFIRMIIVALLAIMLVTLAVANRDAVALRLVPDSVAHWLGTTAYSVTLPLFLVILFAFVIGMVLGLIWEWLRESGLCRASSRRAFDLAKLERESRPHVPPSDDVLAVLEQAPTPGRNHGTSLPASR